MDDRSRIRLLQSGDDAALAEAVHENLGLVRAMVARLHPPREEAEEYFQNGCVGLVLALKKFDPDRGFAFSTFAVPYILGEMRSAARRDQSMHLSRGLQKQCRDLLTLQEDLEKRTGGRVSLAQLAEAAGLPVEQAAWLLSCKLPLRSWNGEHGEESAPEPPSPADTETEALRHLLLREAMAGLSEREVKLLALRYFKDQTQQETAKALDVSQVQVSRMEKKILARLREKMREVG